MVSFLPRSPIRWVLALVLCCAGIDSTVQAQLLDSALPTPRLLTVFPPGGKAGTTVEVAFSGADLDEPAQMLFSHPGIKAEPIIPPPPPPPDPKKPAKPAAPTPITRFKVAIAPDVPLGVHDVRVVGRWGVSNPRAFVVGDLNEVVEKEPNNDIEQAQRVELNSTINGNLANNIDVDYYVFAGKKGQRVVCSCLAGTIDSRFNPELRVFDSKGRLKAGNRNYHGTDALTDLILPEDGDYVVRLVEFAHIQGNAESFYRLSITTAPWIDAVYPPMVESGKSAQVTLWGRNLPGGKPDPTAEVDGRVLDRLTVTVNAPADPLARQRLTFSGRLAPNQANLDGFEYRLRNNSGASHPVLLTFATAPVVLDNETPRTSATPQEVPVPCEIAGRIEKPRDRDWYAFNAKKGQALNIEVFGERLGSPTSMFFVIRNSTTNQDLFESPDNPDTVSMKFYGRTDDPAPYRFVPPADGKYLLLVSSRLADVLAGPRHVYRVRLTPDQPDFRLAVVPFAGTRPDGPTVHQGGTESFTVIAYRTAGFTGDIALTAEGLPPGVTCPPQTLGGGVRTATLVLVAADGAAPTVSAIKIKGTAAITGQQTVREARSGGVVWPLPQPQVVMPTISRLDRGLFLAVRDKTPFQLTASLDKNQLRHGEKGTLSVKLKRLWPDFKQPLAVQITEVPANLTVNNNQPITIAAGKTDGSLPIQVNANAQPGVYNLVLRASAQVPFNKDPKAAQKPATNVVQVSTPVSLAIVPKSLGTLTLNTPNPTVKVGGQGAVVLRVARLFNYTGEFKVEVVMPPAVKGVAITPVIIPAGQDEARLIINAPADSMPGNRGGLIVRLSALYNGTVPTVSPDVPLTVNVVK